MATENVVTIFSAVDRVSKPLAAVHAAGTRLKSAMGGIMNLGILGGGLAAAFGLTKTLHGLDATYKTVARIKAMTGIAATEAHSLADAFELAGVEGEAAERIILAMSRKAAVAAGANTKEAKNLNAVYKKLGVDMSQGPSKVLLQMSKAATDGKLGIAGVMKIFGVGRAQAMDFMKMLQKGPEKIDGFMKSTLKSGDLITEQALKNFEAMQQAKRNLADSWQGVAGAFYKTIVPTVTKFLNFMSGHIDGWADGARRFGEFLVEHMGTAVTLAKVFAGYMAADKLSSVVTGRGAISTVSGLLAMGAGRAARPGIAALTRADQFAPGGIDLASRLSGGAGGAGRLLGGLGSVARIAGIGVVLFGIVKAVGMLAANAGGFRDRIGSLLSKIGSGFAGVAKSLQPVWTVFNKLATVVGTVLLAGVEGILRVINMIMPVVNLMAKAIGGLINLAAKLVSMIPSFGMNVTGDLNGGEGSEASVAGMNALKVNGKWVPVDSDAAVNYRARRNARTRMQGLANRAAPVVQGLADYGKNLLGNILGTNPTDTRQKNEINFFPGAKVDVHQEFSKEFDMDRIAAATAGGIAKMGARRLQSGLSPIMTPR